MADNVDNDVCSYIGKSNSTSTNNLKQIDLIQSNQQQQQHHEQQPLDDADHINSTISSEVSVHFQFITRVMLLLF